MNLLIINERNTKSFILVNGIMEGVPAKSTINVEVNGDEIILKEKGLLTMKQTFNLDESKKPFVKIPKFKFMLVDLILLLPVLMFSLLPIVKDGISTYRAFHLILINLTYLINQYQRRTQPQLMEFEI